MLKNVFILILAISIFSCSNKKQTVDLIIHHGTIYSVDSAFTIYEAMAVTDGKIVALNNNDEILKHYTSSQIIDLDGQPVFPGFIDAHCHFLGYGLGLSKVNLVGTKSFSEVINRVVTFTKKELPNQDKKNIHLSTTSSKEWITGRGWDQNDWGTATMPDNRVLDSLFPDRPVFLTRIDGHAALVNSEALRQAGITNTTKILGGEFLKINNKLSGVLIDNAVDLVKNFIPQADKNEITNALLNAEQNCLAYGLTTVDDAGLMKKDIDIIDELQKNNRLKIRMYAMLSDSLPNYEHYLKTGPYKSERLTVNAFKFYADGAMGSRGACLLQEYNDKKNWKGFLLSERKHFEDKANELAQSGFQMATHCIGDSAYKVILHAYKKAGIKKDRRWRIEHAQVVNPNEMKLSDEIIPSVQPTHATSDMYWITERLGQTRSKYAYAYKELLKVAGIVALGTDFPVEDISPFKTFYAATARKDAKGYPKGGFQNENALSREETLRGMTIWAAYSNFEEQEKGSLEPGKLADFIVLDKNIMTCEPELILQTRVYKTYIKGEMVYQMGKK
jgi:predicted amidohydrolase YtcJ